MVETAMRAGHKVLVEVDNCVLIVVDPRGIWGQQLRPRSMHYLNIIIIHECNEQSEHSQIKGNRNGIKNFAHPYMAKRARVYLSVGVNWNSTLFAQNGPPKIEL
jgi:hypothetical protein